MPGDWTKAGVDVTVANAEALKDLIRYKVAFYGLGRSMDIQTTGTGAVESAPQAHWRKGLRKRQPGGLCEFPRQYPPG